MTISAERPARVETVVDCDVHPVLANDVRDLLPYASASLRRSLTGTWANSVLGEAGRPVGRYTHPARSGNLRGDAVPPNGGPPGSDPKFVVEDHLNGRGVDAAVMIPLATLVWPHMDQAPEVVSALNNFLANEWLTVDPRFKLAAIVFPIDAVKAADEIRRWAGHPSVVAVSVPLIDIPLGDPHYEPIFAAASEAGLPILVHPSGAESTYLAGPGSAGGLPQSFVERHITLSQVASSSLCSLIWRGVFDRYPDMHVVFVEYGFTWVPWLAERLDAEWTALDPVDRPTRELPSSYIWDRVRFTTQPVEETVEPADMVQVMEAMHGERTILFSSDYPHWDSDDAKHVLRGLGPELRARVVRGNAIDTFRLTLPDQVPAGVG
jgi:predicted TIM-barrel fold metal-dependent hydrolase